jgi:hypothetical protein
MAAGAAAFIAGSSTAFAQQHAQQQDPRGGAAERSAPNAPAGPKAGESANHGLPGGPGAQHNGAADNQRRNAAEDRGERSKQNRAGEAQNRGRSETTGQAPQGERREQSREGQRTEPNRATEERSREQNRTTEQQRSNERNRATEQRSNERDRTTTGQGAAPSKGPSSNLSVNVTPENRTRIHDVFIKERSAPRVDHVDFSLAVGTPVPRSVRIVAVPRQIVEIEPRWRGYEYFMVGDQIVIVDPRSMEIVAVLEV